MVTPVFVRSEFNYDVDEASRQGALFCEDESLAIQSQRDESDINTIVARFGLTGTVPVGLVPPTFADFDDVFDFQSAMNAVKSAERKFMRIPAALRARFGNDPHAFVEFCSDKENLPELRKMGLAPPAVAVDTPVTPDVPAKE